MSVFQRKGKGHGLIQAGGNTVQGNMRSYADGRGELMGPTTMGQVLDKTGLAMWRDASKTDTIVQDATGKVSRWNDLSGNNYYAEQTTAANQPAFAAGVIRGKPAVDFGNWLAGNGLGLWMRFKNASGADQNINTIRTVFAVVRGRPFC
jgi:hypothetical protein